MGNAWSSRRDRRRSSWFVPIRLYHIPLSPPGYSAQLALRHKQIAFRVVELLGGFHPPLLRVLGFRGNTVPVMKLEDGTKVEGSLAIMQALERVAPGAPSLYPEDAVERRAVEDAERWGEGVLQDVPRRVLRWGLNAQLSQRQWFADVASPFPLPKVTGFALRPIVPLFVRQAGAYDDSVRSDVAALPSTLDVVDRYIADGVIGDPAAPNAADFQIAGSLAMLSAFADLRPLFDGRPCLGLTIGLIPDYPAIPAALPASWVPAARNAAS